MRTALVSAFSLILSLVAGCAGFDDALRRISGTGVERTFAAPIARVKPAFVTTLNQMGMQISAIELRGKNEVLRARKGDRTADIELERLNATSTRVQVRGSDDGTASQIIRETEKRLGAG